MRSSCLVGCLKVACLMCSHVWLQEVAQLVRMIQGDIDPSKLVAQTVATLPSLSRQLMLQWSDRVLAG